MDRARESLKKIYFPPKKIVSGLVAESDKVLVGELNKWVANPLGPGQTIALQICLVQRLFGTQDLLYVMFY